MAERLASGERPGRGYMRILVRFDPIESINAKLERAGRQTLGTFHVNLRVAVRSFTATREEVEASAMTWLEEHCTEIAGDSPDLIDPEFCEGIAAGYTLQVEEQRGI